MKIEGTYLLSASQEKAWKLLVDPVVIARCIPGCEKLEPEGDNTYAAVLSVGVASIRGKYLGQFKLQHMQPPSQYQLQFDGKGTQGFVKGIGVINLEDKDGQTIVHYSGDVQIGGALASIGQRMLQGAARMMAGQLFSAIEAEAGALTKAEAMRTDVIAPKHGFFREFLRYLLALIKRYFRG